MSSTGSRRTTASRATGVRSIAVAAGQPIAYRADGAAIDAPEDGYVVFPSPNAIPGREWFYFARARLGRERSAAARPGPPRSEWWTATGSISRVCDAQDLDAAR